MLPQRNCNRGSGSTNTHVPRSSTLAAVALPTPMRPSLASPKEREDEDYDGDDNDGDDGDETLIEAEVSAINLPPPPHCATRFQMPATLPPCATRFQCQPPDCNV